MFLISGSEPKFPISKILFNDILVSSDTTSVQITDQIFRDEDRKLELETRITILRFFLGIRDLDVSTVVGKVCFLGCAKV